MPLPGKHTYTNTRTPLIDVDPFQLTATLCRTLDPSLRFSGSLLGDLCTALWPPSPPAPVSCCPRSWALLMAALTQQACISALSQEYASLPGRCESVLNRTGMLPLHDMDFKYVMDIAFV